MITHIEKSIDQAGMVVICLERRVDELSSKDNLTKEEQSKLAEHKVILQAAKDYLKIVSFYE